MILVKHSKWMSSFLNQHDALKRGRHTFFSNSCSDFFLVEAKTAKIFSFASFSTYSCGTYASILIRMNERMNEASEYKKKKANCSRSSDNNGYYYTGKSYFGNANANQNAKNLQLNYFALCFCALFIVDCTMYTVYY